MSLRGYCALLGVAGILAASVQAVAQDEAPPAKPKYTIKQVMEDAHKAGLLKKVLAGEASQEDKLNLLDHYVSLTENEPPRGDVEDWQEKVNAVVVAAAKVTVGRDDGTALLKKVTNCVACHREHKPPTN